MNARIRFTCMLFMLCAALTATFAAQAQPPLAVVDAPSARSEIVPGAVTVHAPMDGATVSSSTALVWSGGYSAVWHKIIVDAAGTGERFAFRVEHAKCDMDACSTTIRQTPIFDHLHDGDGFTWRVIVKGEAGKAKSAMHYQVADTVIAPETLLPADGANLLPIHNLTWNDSAANASYTVIIRDADTKAVALKYIRHADDCDDVCSVHPQSDGLDTNTPYEWFVRARGTNGDKANSHKQQFTVLPSVMMH